MDDIQSEIRDLVERFAADVSALARKLAVSTLTGAFGGTSQAAARTKAPNGSRAKGGKRAADELQNSATKVQAFINENPGLRIGQINAALGTTTKDLALPLRKLVGAGMVKTEGTRRGTQYFPGTGSRKRAAKQKRGKPSA